VKTENNNNYDNIFYKKYLLSPLLLFKKCTQLIYSEKESDKNL